MLRGLAPVFFSKVWICVAIMFSRSWMISLLTKMSDQAIRELGGTNLHAPLLESHTRDESVVLAVHGSDGNSDRRRKSTALGRRVTSL